MSKIVIFINTNIRQKEVRNWCRNQLSSYLNKKISIYEGEYGKPYVKEDIYFNASHSHNYGVMAISLDGEIGVDFEKLRAKKDFIIKSDFISIYPDSMQKLKKWVFLEAYTKMIGVGFYGGIDFDFCYEKSQQPINPLRAYRYKNTFLYGKKYSQITIWE